MRFAQVLRRMALFTVGAARRTMAAPHHGVAAMGIDAVHETERWVTQMQQRQARRAETA